MKAIANPHRQEILRLVWDRELSSREIASQFDLTWPTVSFNLKVLREAGLVRERRDGTRRLYIADRKALRPVEGLLRELWRTRLQRLGDLAEREARRRRKR